jgi:TRAP-type C4-dicarboxylate transport system permease small subunit
MRRSLDLLYTLALWAAALCLVAICALVGAQVIGRIVDNALVLMGQRRFGFIILSLSEICGFLLAAASFLALAGTLKAGAHIRVTLIIGFLPSRLRHGFEIGVLAFSTLATAYATWFAFALARDSFRFNELSIGLLPIPLWIPQSAIVTGLAILTIAFLDELARVVRGAAPSFRAAEDAIQLGKEA